METEAVIHIADAIEMVGISFAVAWTIRGFF